MPHPAANAAIDPTDVLKLAEDVAVELHPHRRRSVPTSLGSRLDKDLGLDSLGRVELLLRLERRFGRHLPESVLGEANTVGDLVAALARAGAALLSLPGAGARPTEATAVAAPPDAATLLDVLDWHARQHPDRPHLILESDTGAELAISYRQLADSAGATAAGLRAQGLGPGATVAIMLPTGPDFFRCFFGILLAGGIPVPIYPPFRPSQIEEHLVRQAKILANAEAAWLLAAPEAIRVARLLRAQVPSLRDILAPADLTAPAAAGFAKARLQAEDLALIQYTSGSTGDPKGVELSHRNLLANIRAMGAALEASADDVFVSWLPLYHDMGLIGAWLGSLYYAAPVVILSPLRVLARPESWLWAIHRHRGTLTAAPNFGYELCVRKIPDAAIQGLDLGSLRLAVNGAEPVSPLTIRRFSDRFAPYGFRPEAMAPVYGLAECSVGLAFPPPGRPPWIDRIDRAALTRRGEAAPVAADDAAALELPACGRALPGHEIRIVDDLGRELGDRQEGRLQFRGPSATRGYHRSPDKTAALFDGAWLESGDLAYTVAGDIFLTGRSKDIIIRAGRNIHPHEVEDALGEVAGLRKGCIAVIGSTDAASGTERVVVLAETRTADASERADLRQRIDEVVSALLEAPADDIVLLPPHGVLKTSSGKIRRAACRASYEQGRLGQPPRAVWRQVVGLVRRAALERGRLLLRGIASLLYAGWWWAIVALLAGPAWLAGLLLPKRRWRWQALGLTARLLFRLTGTRLRVEGLEHLPAGAAVLAANHASYVDGLALAAALPQEALFTAKTELARQFFAGLFLRRLGTLFVERFDPRRGVEDVAATIAAARRGERLVFFPEGTLIRSPGLLPFRLGAFQVAAEAGVPVVPVAIRGTRSLLRGEQWFPRPADVVVTIAPPIAPAGAGFSDVIALRDHSRAELLRLVGEPDLAEVAPA